METSAKTGENVNEAFARIAAEIKKNIPTDAPADDTIRVGEGDGAGGGGKCKC